MVFFAMMFFLLIPVICSAATIQGAVYDISLERVSDVVVEINTVPKQQLIAKDGYYSFNVGKGNYTLSARQLKGGQAVASVTENISVQAEGVYTLDLVLFPGFSEEGELLQEIGGMELEDLLEERADYSLFILAGMLIIAVFLAALFIRVSRIGPVQEPGLPVELEKVLKFIKKEGGRVTQKDIRKEFGFSEAKISLMVADLEGRGAVKKIKKGRGNIIILKKNSLR